MLDRGRALVVRPAMNSLPIGPKPASDLGLVAPTEERRECPVHGTSVLSTGLSRQRDRDTFLSRSCDTQPSMEERPRSAAIASAVKAWIEFAGLNPTDLHKRTGIARNTLYEIMAGKRAPSLDVLERIAPEIGTTPGKLVDGVLPTGDATPPARRPVLEDRVDQMDRDFLESQEAFGRSEQRFSELIEILANEPALPEQTRQRLRLVLPRRAS
jgi:transcriptional regulator with XRE-family HTH domain